MSRLAPILLGDLFARGNRAGPGSYFQKQNEPGALHERIAQIPGYWLDVNAPPPERTHS